MTGAVIVRVLTMGLLLVTAAPAAVQPPAGVAALKKALEGREVTVRIDMPATSGGIDLYLQREPDIDAAAYGMRLKTFGTAIRRGDRVPITLIKVNKKNIEVQLAGGGYGTRGDEVAIAVPAYVAKTTRERDLERERDRTKDEARQREIDRELRSLQYDRERDNLAASQRADQDRVLKEAGIARKRLQKGSRLNVWYADRRLEQWVPTPEDLMLSLARYVDFGSAPAPPAATQDRVADGAASLRAGMTAAEVYDRLGFPDRRRATREGDQDASVETWESRRRIIDVTFVGGVVVRFTNGSR